MIFIHGSQIANKINGVIGTKKVTASTSIKYGDFFRLSREFHKSSSIDLGNINILDTVPISTNRSAILYMTTGSNPTTNISIYESDSLLSTIEVKLPDSSSKYSDGNITYKSMNVTAGSMCVMQNGIIVCILSTDTPGLTTNSYNDANTSARIVLYCAKIDELTGSLSDYTGRHLTFSSASGSISSIYSNYDLIVNTPATNIKCARLGNDRVAFIGRYIRKHYDTDGTTLKWTTSDIELTVFSVRAISGENGVTSSTVGSSTSYTYHLYNNGYVVDKIYGMQLSSKTITDNPLYTSSEFCPNEYSHDENNISAYDIAGISTDKVVIAHYVEETESPIRINTYKVSEQKDTYYSTTDNILRVEETSRVECFYNNALPLTSIKILPDGTVILSNVNTDGDDSTTNSGILTQEVYFVDFNYGTRLVYAATIGEFINESIDSINTSVGGGIMNIGYGIGTSYYSTIVDNNDDYFYNCYACIPIADNVTYTNIVFINENKAAMYTSDSTGSHYYLLDIEDTALPDTTKIIGIATEDGNPSDTIRVYVPTNGMEG